MTSTHATFDFSVPELWTEKPIFGPAGRAAVGFNRGFNKQHGYACGFDNGLAIVKSSKAIREILYI